MAHESSNSAETQSIVEYHDTRTSKQKARDQEARTKWAMDTTAKHMEQSKESEKRNPSPKPKK